MRYTILSLLLIPQLLFAQGKLEQAMIRQGLVDIQQVDPTIRVDLKYSTTDNFIGKDVYGDLTRAYLQPMAARKLATASKLLRQKHPDLRLLVYDATRPRSAQWDLWHTLKHLPVNERGKYVSNPRNGSVHNFGCAVDLTLATKAGKPLDMGTQFDYFGELAYPIKEDQLLKHGKLTQKQVDNRRLLRSVMKQAGFAPLSAEWWHFNALSRAEAKKQYKIVE
ncbi:M15 family metallopeptidase [Larkinella insperata]|uniref:D-alanyl-D-alanine dipeptidase n=1 Tax=Larkinella insperata TaxID=332158 RepID=A0ABW3QM27_9BACT|nr:M15 family metallopeptidase [Larkinella insperata]